MMYVLITGWRNDWQHSIVLLPVVDANGGIAPSDEDRVVVDHASIAGDAWRWHG